MKPEAKFSIKTYIYYLIMEPWITKFHLPNFRTLVWVFIVISFLLKKPLLLFISIGIGVVLHIINEYKSGKHIYWYKQRKYRERDEALKKVRDERKRKEEEQNIK